MRRPCDHVSNTAAGLLLVAGLFLLLAGCSTEPYQVKDASDPPWELGRTAALPDLDPPLSDRAHRIALCYGGIVNSEEDVLAWAEELCGDGRLLVENQNVFWNGCSVLQPWRITYICDPPEPAPEAGN